MNKKGNKFIVLLFVIWGLVLSNVVPALDAFYREIYSDWQTNKSFNIFVFHWPNYIWLAIFLFLATVIFLLGNKFENKNLKIVNYVSITLFIIIVILTINWLGSVILLHPTLQKA